MTNLEVFVALDLGGDTLKVAFAYKQAGKEIFGKIVPSDFDITAVPAVAKYDEAQKKWLYESEVDRDPNEYYVTIVKIKDLLSLLSESRSNNGEVRAQNRRYYFDGGLFPKFFFPVKPEDVASFAEMVRKQRTFEAPGYTPHTVCQGYFNAVAAMIKERLQKYFSSKISDQVSFRVNYSIVTPPHVGKDYIVELTNLIGTAFERAQFAWTKKGKALSMTKALGAYAMQRGLIKDENTLIFNIGEEKTFVVKANCINGGLSIDGVDGHEPEINLGGYDIDQAVADHLEEGLKARGAVGAVSSENGQHAESGLYSKQYLFLKSLKSAKIILGINASKHIHPEGVSVSVAREFVLKTMLRYEDFAKCVGLTDGNGVAQRIVNYIQAELSRRSNKNVHKIFLTGGVVETVGLTDYIRKKVETKDIKVYTFENELSEEIKFGMNSFTICAHEDSLYAPCVGCLIVAMRNLTVDTVTALTYGLLLYRFNSNGGTLFKFFSEYIFKGTRLKEGDNIYTIPKIIAGNVKSSASSSTLYVLSTPLSKTDIRSGNYETRDIDGIKHLVLDDINDPVKLKQMEKSIGLQRLKDGQLTYKYNGLRVEIAERYLIGQNVSTSSPIGYCVYMDAGVCIDETGRARVYARNCKEENAKYQVKIKFLEGNGRIAKDSVRYVPADEIEFAIDIEFDAK